MTLLKQQCFVTSGSEVITISVLFNKFQGLVGCPIQGSFQEVSTGCRA